VVEAYVGLCSSIYDDDDEKMMMMMTVCVLGQREEEGERPRGPVETSGVSAAEQPAAE